MFQYEYTGLQDSLQLATCLQFLDSIISIFVIEMVRFETMSTIFLMLIYLYDNLSSEIYAEILKPVTEIHNRNTILPSLSATQIVINAVCRVQEVIFGNKINCQSKLVKDG